MKSRGTALIAGWSSPVARQAHNLKVVGSNPAPATKKKKASRKVGFFVFGIDVLFFGGGKVWGKMLVKGEKWGKAMVHRQSMGQVAKKYHNQNTKLK